MGEVDKNKRFSEFFRFNLGPNLWHILLPGGLRELSQSCSIIIEKGHEQHIRPTKIRRATLNSNLPNTKCGRRKSAHQWVPGLLMRPEHCKIKAQTETRECETETENLLWDRDQKLRDRDRDQDREWDRDQSSQVNCMWK